MSKEEITKHKYETHEVAVALPALRSFSEGGSRACPELAVALSLFGYAQGKHRRRGSRMDLPSTTSRNIKPYLALQGIIYYAVICHPSSISPLTIHQLTTHHLTRIQYRESSILSSLWLVLNSAFWKFIIVIRKARTRFTYKLFLTLPPIETNI